MIRYTIPILSCIALLLIIGGVSASPELKVQYINVSSGDATLLQTQGNTVLVDAGPAETGKEVVNFLKNMSVTSIDYVFASNLNESSIGGMNEILEAFPVGEFIDSGAMKSSPSYDTMTKTITEKQIPHTTAKTGSNYLFGTANIELLNSTQSAVNVSDNSLAIRVTDGAVSFLFEGSPDQTQTPATIFTVPGLGSSGSVRNLQAISPDIAIISSGTPAKDTLDILKKANVTSFRTDTDGSIQIKTDGNTYTVTTSKGKTYQKPTPTPTTTQKSGLPSNKSYADNRSAAE